MHRSAEKNSQVTQASSLWGKQASLPARVMFGKLAAARPSGGGRDVYAPDSGAHLDHSKRL
jgi:hypothetical protein